MKTKEEIREFMKENFEEIEQFDFDDLDYTGECRFCCSDGDIYFKPKEKFPKVFENKEVEVAVWDNTCLRLEDKRYRDVIVLGDEDIELLKSALEERERMLRSKND